MSSFSDEVRRAQLNSAGVVRRWLETHTAVQAASIYIETDQYYSREAYRAVIWRMVQNEELLPTDVEGIYVAGPNLKRSVDRPPVEEIGLVAHFMPLHETARLYNLSPDTVKAYKRKYHKAHPEVAPVGLDKRVRKLTLKEARAIKNDYTTKQTVLAKRYSVTQVAISAIQRGKAWRSA